MGSDAHVVVVAPGPPNRAGAEPAGSEAASLAETLVDWAVERIAQLERRWSRFLPDSELSRLNAAPGLPALVSNDTLVLVRRATDAWRLTGGRFDPTVIDAVERLGYTETFDALSARRSVVAALGDPSAAPGCAGVMIDDVVGAVTLPPGVRLDPGGIGKGLAADLVAEELMAGGALGAMVNLGGDLRAIGTPPEGGVWVVGVDDPTDPGHELARVVLVQGAVCTSSRAKRAWDSADGRRVHHLVDPATGTPIEGEVVAVTVLAGQAWWAEATAKVLFAAGPAAGPEARPNASALFVMADGALVAVGDDVEAFVTG